LLIYQAPAASSGHGNFNGIEAVEPRNSTWLRHADLLVSLMNYKFFGQQQDWWTGLTAEARHNDTRLQ
jgi:hypothetical protein